MSTSKKELRKKFMALKDKDIDYSDIPPLTEKDLKATVMLSHDVFSALKKRGKDINSVIRKLLKSSSQKHAN